MDVFLRHGSHRGEFILAERFPMGFNKQLHQRLAPILSVTQQTQITERFLRRAESPLPLAELVAEGDKQAAEPAALVLREREDTGEVVPLGGVLLLGEVPDEMAAGFVAGAHAVEEEGVDVVVEGLVIQEELAEKAEVAAPGALATAVDLEEGDVVVAVDLVAGRVDERALGAVALEGAAAVEVAEAELVDVDHVDVGVGGWVGREVPGLDVELAHLETVEVADAVDLRRILRHAAAGSEPLELLLPGHLALFFLGLGLGEADVDHVDVVGLRFGGSV